MKPWLQPAWMRRPPGSSSLGWGCLGRDRDARTTMQAAQINARKIFLWIPVNQWEPSELHRNHDPMPFPEDVIAVAQRDVQHGDICVWYKYSMRLGGLLKYYSPAA
jgi:hypothetical protein